MVTLPSLYERDGIEAYTDALLDFVASPLVRQITGGIHVNDALIYRAWEALPPAWTSWWSTLPSSRLAQQDLIDVIDEKPLPTAITYGKQNAQDRPQSLTEWLGKLHSLALPRAQRHCTRVELPKILTERMKTKKIDEVSVATAYIRDVCQNNGITHIIDMGSGQGYLSLSLAYLFPNLRVLAIDGSERQIAASKTAALELSITEDRVQHLVRYIDGTSLLTSELADWAKGQNCMLVGLHACGNLSEHMIRYFTTAPFITHLGAVGCCYNHIIPRSLTHPDGFPISQRLRQRDTKLSATALMTGCQAPNNWEKPSESADSSVYSKRRFYRALLEKVFHDEGIRLDTESRPVWGVRKGDMTSFVAFAKRAMHCLNIDQKHVADDDELNACEARHRDRGDEHKIAVLWTLSVLCCKVVESVIAMDRYWYLVENGAQDGDVLPIFDYKISPRNLMMVASKPSGQVK